MRLGQLSAAHVLLGVGLAVGFIGPTATVSAREAGPVRQSMLHVLLTASPQLSPASRAALVAEATAIWQRAGIRLTWIAASDGSLPPAHMLRVLVIPRPAPSSGSSEKYVLGELVSFGRPGALALASIERAAEIVAATHAPRLVPASWHEGQVGLVLGRAVAHEIGHYLLNTRGHSRAGLMRAAFDIGELVDQRSGAFDLDNEGRAWLQDRIERQLPIGPVAESPGPSKAGHHVVDTTF